MSKKYKNKLCVYCGEKVSTTGDHVFARGFCLEQHRSNLPQVPACEKCNKAKSDLEHYLTTVLPFGARHQHSSATLMTMVPRRLQKNAKLLDELRAGYTADKIPLRSGQIEKLFVLIAKGLLWHHWAVVLTAEDCAAATVIQVGGEGFLEYIFMKMRPRDRVRVELGDGALVYEGIQAKDYSQFTIWRFLVYGGLQFAETSRDPNAKHAIIFALTGPRAPLSKLWSTIFKEEIPAA